MAYILTEKFTKPDGTVVDNGYYGGVMPKYIGVFYFTPDKECAKRFDAEETAAKIAESLNIDGRQFVVEQVD